MKKRISPLVAAVCAGGLGFGCGANPETDGADPSGAAGPAGNSIEVPTIGTAPRLPAELETQVPLPAYMTDAEREAARNRAASLMYQTASPPSGHVAVPAEFDPMAGVLVRIPMQASTQDFFGRMVNEIADSGATPYLLVDSGHEADVVEEYFLSPYGTSRAAVRFIYAYNDAFWARDFGPFHIYVNGQRQIVDMEYYPGRPNDDYIPIAVGDAFDENVYSAPLSTEGGNFMTDGLGTCWASTGVFEFNYLSVAQAKSIYQAFLGCDTIRFIDPLPGEGTTHIDMFSKILDRDTILVAYSSSSLGAYPSQINQLNQAADDYASTPKPGGGSWNIVRIPMVIDNTNGVFYAYTNSLIVNDSVIVPTYAFTTDSQALQVYRDALPGFRIKGVRSDDIIWLGGSVHCTTMQVPEVSSSSSNGFCGDGHRDSGETCDSTSVYCTSLDSAYKGGVAHCNASCSGWSTGNCISSSSGPSGEITRQFTGSVDRGQYDVLSNDWIEAGSGRVSVEMTGTGDADLYVWKDVWEPTWSNYTCRPYYEGSDESCNLDGPGTFLVVVSGYATSSSYSMTLTYTP